MRKLTIAILAFLALTGTAFAQEGPKIVHNTPWATFRFAPPPWSNTGALSQTSTVTRKTEEKDDGRNATLFEAVPKGETADDWQNTYALRAEQGITGGLDDYVTELMAGYHEVCAEIRRVFNRVPSDEERLFILYCSAYTQRPEQGEVVIVKMQLQDEMLSSLTQRIRVPAFDMAQVRRQPPASIDVLRSALVRVASLRAKPL